MIYYIYSLIHKCKYWLSVLCIIGLTSVVEASTGFQTRHLTTVDGLPGNTVRTVWQDSQGFLWIGTSNGLSCYDGHTFTNYRSNPASGAPGLPVNAVTDLYEDDHQYLWVKCSGQYFGCFDLVNERFVDYSAHGPYVDRYSSISLLSDNDAAQSRVALWSDSVLLVVGYADGRSLVSHQYAIGRGGMPDGRISFVARDTASSLWIGTSAGLVRLDCLHDTVVPVMSAVDMRDCRLWHDRLFVVSTSGAIYETVGDSVRVVAQVQHSGRPLSVKYAMSAGDHWLLYSRGLVFDYDMNTGAVQPRPEFSMRQPRRYSSGSDVWMCDMDGKLLLSDGTHDAVMLSLAPWVGPGVDPSPHVSLSRLPDGRILIGSSTIGLYCADASGQNIERIDRTNSSAQPLLPSAQVLCCYTDRQGHAWVGCNRAGLHLLALPRVQGDYWLSPQQEDELCQVRSIRPLPDGTIAVGTRDDGMYSLSHQGQVLSHQQSWPDVYCQLSAADGTLWQGTRGNGLRVGTTTYWNNKNDASSLPSNHIYSLLQDRNQRIWVGTFGGGLALALPQADGTMQFVSFLNDSYGLSRVRCMVQDSVGYIWAATNDGLVRFWPDSLIQQPAAYTLYSATRGTLPVNEIYSLALDYLGHLWVGTVGAGLLCLDISSSQSLSCRSFTTAQGLANNSVTQLLVEADRYLWAGTEYGLSRIDLQQYTVSSYFCSDQMSANCFSENACMQLTDGRMLFGTDRGILVLPTQHRRVPDVSQRTVLSDLLVNGTSLRQFRGEVHSEAGISHSQSFTLSHQQNNLEFQFTEFDYTGRARIQYRYWLEGYDADWSEATSSHTVQYKHLSPGRYKLHVQVCNGEGLWSTENVVYTVRICLPWWFSWWMIIIYLVVAAAVTWLVVAAVRKIHRLEEHIRVEKQMAEFKRKFFSDMREQKFIDSLNQIIEQQMSNADLSIDEIAQEMNMSRSQFYNKVRNLTGYKPNEYLRTMRLQRAAEMLLNQDNLNVSEISFAVGYNDSLYFSKCFKKQFGLSPTQYKNGKTED